VRRDDTSAVTPPAPGVRVRRFDANPIIRPGMLPRRDRSNINGPSLIRAPDWIERPPGEYFLYFAHHGGDYIRLAYADRLEGPWRLHGPGAIRLSDVPAAKAHIASPDAHVEQAQRRVRMYFHAPARAADGQKTFVATSADGLTFTAGDEILGASYFRAFEWADSWYAIARCGDLYRSRDGLTQFEEGPNPFTAASDLAGPSRRDAYGSIRHVAVQVTGDFLWIYYTRLGDSPERILRTRIELTEDWRSWRPAIAPQEVLWPEEDYEGGDLPVRPSRPGAAKGRENAVRDPALFTDRGRTYLIYSVAGEAGLAIAEVVDGAW
jgi:hypothetical protein